MIDRLIEAAVRQRLLVVLLLVGLAGWGVWSYQQVPIDAFPDVTNNQVQILTQVPSLSPVEVEKLVTYPVETAMASLPGVVENRSLSQFGLSAVTIVFEDDVDLYFARQLVFERLSQVEEALPAGAEAEMGPVATGLGEIFQYIVRDDPGEPHRYSLTELRTIQDWVIAPELRSVPGVAEINPQGGYEKQYDVAIRPEALLAYDVTLGDVFTALEESNRNAGGQYIERQGEQLLVRGVGLLGAGGSAVEDLQNTVIASRDGTPVLVADVADVRVGEAVRYGAAVADGVGEVVTGTVMMLKGSNARDVVAAIRVRLDEIRPLLPPGVIIDVYYDRTELVEAAISTVTSALLIGGALVILVLIAFLGDWRSAVIVSLVLPMTALLTFILMDQVGLGANLMSLGGLAIGIGMFVDGSIVMVENVYRLREEHPDQPIVPLIVQAGKEVGRPITFAVGVVVVVFLPLFTLQDLEGRMFRPLALTISFALLASLFLALTMAPALSAYLLGTKEVEKEIDGEDRNVLVRWSKRRYRPALGAALRRPRFVAGASGALVAGAVLLFTALGTEFVPRLEEGSIALSVARGPSISLDDAIRIENDLQRVFTSFPEVDRIVSKIGRAEVATDPNLQGFSDVVITLKPRDTWRFDSKEALVEAMREELEVIPGIAVGFSQPIALRVDELISGVKSQVAVRIYGPDVETLARLGEAVAAVVEDVPGAADVKAEQVAGLGYVQVRVRRRDGARYGIPVADVARAVETAVGGSIATEVIEGDRRFGVQARYAAPARSSADAIGEVRLETSSGARVRLADVADVEIVEGPVQVSREDARRVLTVESNVTGRDIGSFVEEAQAAVARQVDFPPGYLVTWGGQFENQQRAQARLAFIIPITLIIIFVLLFITFGSVRQAVLVLLNLPVSLVGGVLFLWLFGLYMSVPASVGFIALLGIAVQNGIVMVSFINDLREEGWPLAEAVREGALLRLRPILMTGATTLLGLIPLLFATGIGSEVQRPLAAVVVGGLFTATVSTLLLLPALYRWFAAPERDVEL